MGLLPSAQELLQEAIDQNPKADINTLHEKAYDILLIHKSEYYKGKVDAFLQNIECPPDIKSKLKKKMLEPVSINDVPYSNFMEEASRRISQSIQPTSGRVAERCAGVALEKSGLISGVHFSCGHKKRSDIFIHHPNMASNKAEHRIEVKNVKLRERVVRGLSFDGDSLIGFFNDVSEFSPTTISIIDELCIGTNGYFYVPPSILNALHKDKLLSKNTRIKSNTDFGKDMAKFCKTGSI